MVSATELGLLIGAAGFWILMSIAWAPFLAANRIKALFQLGPTGDTILNYEIAMAGMTVIQFLITASAVITVGGRAGLNLMQFFELVVTITVLYLIGIWLLISVLFPRMTTWDPAGEGVDGRLILAVGGVWYLLWTAIFVATFNFIAFLWAFPG